ncbi:hypothetical protein GGR54DRAFT_652536 [Hypoxylon sp. NC1633]|nr:hypothetical protein GGR54DRAFT_652536 [Hypoxylon sp. NC1633]
MTILTRRHVEPVAICGMAMRLPGGIKTPESYWDVLYNGKDMRSPVPISRYNIKGFNDSMGKTNVIRQQHAYFLEDDLASFDAGLFTMTRNELEKADPQQRLLLMVVRECLESAGVTDYRGSLTGLFVGTFSEDWLQTQSREEQHATGYVLTGHLDPMLANRVAFEYDLRGPCFVVKTACSSSMIALHNAVRAVQTRDCNAAIVSGSNLNMGPITTASMTQEGIMSPEGSCKTFDARADGYGRGEAVNAIYIKPLSDAIRDGNPIRAVIRNTGINQDGQSVGLFATSIVAQEALMRKAYADVGLNPTETAMVECHGTGTPVGDPVEATSVANVFSGPNGIIIGSVKPNLGHSEGSAGISSLMKAVLSLEHKTIPPNIKFEVPNPQIPFKEKNITVPIRPMSWPEGKAHRISVNSFGIGGTNAHCIVESAEQYIQELSQSRLGSELAIISANSQDSLKAGIENLKQYISSHPNSKPDLSYTLSRRREHFKWRSFAVLSGADTVSFKPPTNKPNRTPPVVMVFSGQGAQWPQMGYGLLATLPGFKEDVLAMDDILQSLKDRRPTWKAIEELSKPDSSNQLGRAELAQPLSTVVQIGLVNALKRLGVSPQAVVGHSSGEIAAAYATGALTIREAVTAAYYRGFVSKTSTTPGGMAAIGLGAEETRKYLPDRVVVACENSPSSTTISGDLDQLQVALTNLKSALPDTFARALKVEMAYHSHHMVALSEAYRSCLNDEFASFCQRQETDVERRVPLFSSLRGKKITDIQQFGPQYWIDNLTSPVLFNSAVQSIIGPHSTLQGPIREIYVNVDFAYLYPSGKPRISREWRLRPYGQHELLGRKVAESTSINPSWRLVLVPDHVPIAGYSVKNARVTTALVLGDQPKEIYYHFNVSSHNGTTWIIHCEGLQPLELPRVADAARWFETFAKVGFNYGPKFQLLDNFEEIMKGPFLFHPTTMDACLQLAIIAGSKEIEELEVYRDDMNVVCVADEKALLKIRGLRFTLLPNEDDEAAALKFTLLCMLDSKYGKWVFRMAEKAVAGHSPVAKDASKLVSLPRSEIAPYAGLYTGSVDPAQLLMENDILPNVYSAINFDYARYIGAGAGGTTEAILSQIIRDGKLPPYSVYTAPNIEYKVFDADSFDLILAPHGCLLLSEPATVGAAPGFIFADGREWEPFRSGFTGADNVVYDAQLPYRYWSTIIARPKAAVSAEKTSPVVLVSEGGKTSSDLAEGLSKSGIPHNVIFALDLEKPFFEDISAENWMAFKALMKKCESISSRKLLWLLPPAQKNCQNPKTELGLSLTTLEVDTSDADLQNMEFLVENGTIKLTSKTQNGTTNGAVASHSIGGLASFDPEASYIVAGGLGGLGRAICSWMAEHGARFITVISRSAGRSIEDKSFIAEMKSMECVLTPIAGHIQDFQVVRSAVVQSPKPVKGVIHLAMVLRDALFPDMTYEEWKEGISPKVDGAWNLHNALLGVSLDFFVVTSSIVSTINVPGQANYNAANIFLEAFCQYRNGLGLAASAIAVSPIDDIGVVVGNDKARRNLRSNGLQFLNEREVLQYIQLGIMHRAPTPIIMGLHSDTHLDDAANHVAWKKDRRMGLYHNITKGDNAGGEDSTEGNILHEFITNATASPAALDSPESIEFLAMEIGKRVYSFMLKPIEEVDITLSLVEVGLDSLMAVELRRLWNQMFGLTISVLEIMSLGALENFGKLAAQGLKQRFLVEV